ncbi:MAG: hypothetical protein EKK64_04870 [Neisseriaceae bacterium]|nr:MAG: hypothetical protein EKK64_04870 [Neisseriaceae bacterium]
MHIMIRKFRNRRIEKEYWTKKDFGHPFRKKYFRPAKTVFTYGFNLPYIKSHYYFAGDEYNLINDTLIAKVHSDFISKFFFDNPSVIYRNGTKEWYFKDDVKFYMLHRENGLPAIEYSNGDKEWWRFGQRHRENGPAVIYGKKQYWYSNGVFHTPNFFVRLICFFKRILSREMMKTKSQNCQEN